MSEDLDSEYYLAQCNEKDIELIAANERIRELEAEAKMPGKCARAIAPLLEDLAAERAVSDRLLEALQRIAKLRIVEVDEVLDDYADTMVRAMRKEKPE